MIWDSMIESGSAALYESNQMLGNLLATEGDHRKLRIELEKAPDDDSSSPGSTTSSGTDTKAPSAA